MAGVSEVVCFFCRMEEDILEEEWQVLADLPFVARRNA